MRIRTEGYYFGLTLFDFSASTNQKEWQRHGMRHSFPLRSDVERLNETRHSPQLLHITVMASRRLPSTLKQAVRSSVVSPRSAINHRQAPWATGIPTTSSRASPFHSSRPKAILPAGPRTFPKISISSPAADCGCQQRLFKELVCHPIHDFEENAAKLNIT